MIKVAKQKGPRIDKNSIILVVLAIAFLFISFLLAGTDSSLTGLLVKGKADVKVITADGVTDRALRDARVYVKGINDERLTYVGRTNRAGERTVRLSEGTYEFEVTAEGYVKKEFSLLLRDGDKRNVNVILIKEGYEVTCLEGTNINSCSGNQPYYCDTKGELNQRCDLCGCPQGLSCNTNGRCS